uniref:Uncharacterized protein n=1 Tax=Anguilla anguilla TaxID=7936 RepID=A0A0E9XRP6_ANGAN
MGFLRCHMHKAYLFFDRMTKKMWSGELYFLKMTFTLLKTVHATVC